jgi:hypothetical protein
MRATMVLQKSPLVDRRGLELTGHLASERSCCKAGMNCFFSNISSESFLIG